MQMYAVRTPLDVVLRSPGFILSVLRAAASRLSWLDVRDLAKHDGGIEFSLERTQPLVACPICLPHGASPRFEVILERIHVHCLVDKRFQPFPEVARPMDAPGVVC